MTESTRQQQNYYAPLATEEEDQQDQQSQREERPIHTLSTSTTTPEKKLSEEDRAKRQKKKEKRTRQRRDKEEQRNLAKQVEAIKENGTEQNTEKERVRTNKKRKKNKETQTTAESAKETQDKGEHFQTLESDAHKILEQYWDKYKTKITLDSCMKNTQHTECALWTVQHDDDRNIYIRTTNTQADEVIDKVETVKEILQNSTALQKRVSCRLKKEEFQEILQNIPDTATIVQKVNSKEYSRLPFSEVSFFIFGRGDTCQTEKHIYWDTKKFWNIHLEEWDEHGEYQKKVVPRVEPKSTLRKQCRIQTQYHKNKVLISHTVFGKLKEDNSLREIITMFEGTNEQVLKQDKRVFIGILGTRSTGRKTLQTMLHKIQDPTLLEGRVIYFKNSKQYRDILDQYDVTHIVDDREGYIRKGLVARDYIRRAYSMKEKPQGKHKHVHIQHVADWKQLLENIEQKEIERTSKQQKKAKTPRMIEKRSWTVEQKGDTIKFVSWNTNSFRNVHKEGKLTEFLLTQSADVISITEFRGTAEETIILSEVEEILRQKGYVYRYYNEAKPNSGLYGTAIFAKIRPLQVYKNIPGFLEQGRVITTVFETFSMILTYTPTLGWDRENNTLKQDHKIETRERFDKELRKHIQECRKKHNNPVIVTGDLNVCISNNDVWKSTLIDTDFPACTKGERSRILEIMDENNLVEAYEEHNKGRNTFQGRDRHGFTFFFDRRKDKGMKLDHFLTPREWFNHDREDTPLVTKVEVLRNQQGSDHLPIMMVVRFPKEHKFTRYIRKRELRKQQWKKYVHNHEMSNILTDQEIDPLMFRGIAMKSPMTKILLQENEQELRQRVSELLNIFEEIHQEEAETTRRENSENNTVSQEEESRGNTWIPYIHTLFGNEHIKQTMIDTGANNNLMSLETLSTLKPGAEKTLTPADIVLRVGDSHKVQVLGSVWLSFHVGHTLFTEKFYIMTVTTFDIILGAGFQHKHETNLCFREKMITIHKNNSEKKGIKIPMFDKNEISKHSCGYALHTTEEVTLEADKQGYVETRLPKRMRNTFCGKFGEITEPPELLTKTGCATARGFGYMNEGGQFMIKIMNGTGERVQIPKGTKVGLFMPKLEEQFASQGGGIAIEPTEMLQKEKPKDCQNNAFDEEYTQWYHKMESEKTSEEEHTYTEKMSKHVQGQNVGTKDEGKSDSIRPASEIKDFTEEELEKLFEQPGLRELPPFDPDTMCVPGTPNKEQIQKLKQLVAKRRNIFSADETKPKLVKHYSVFIAHDGKPVVEKIRPYTAQEVKVWKEHVQKLLDNGTVEYSDSPWRSASFLVKKPNGGFRFVTDYRKANAHVQKLHWPLMRIDSAISALGNANVISSADANQAYHQIPLADESSKQFTSFAGPTSQLQYRTLPQGYKNSVSEYTKFTSYILGNLLWECCLTYLDDFLIWSKDFETHLEDLDKVFRKIEYYGVQFSPKKTLFCRKELPYLGYVVMPGKGIKANPKKVAAIVELKKPTNKKELGTFLQSVGFYRKMIPLYNSLTAPLRNLYNEKRWPRNGMSEEQEKCWEDLRKCLLKEPVLAIPDCSPHENPFYVLTDASKQGLGAILMQKGKDNKLHPISYASRMTEDRERQRYNTYQLEMSAIIWALQVFKPYLRHKAVPFILKTDCKSLLWLMTTDHDTNIKKWIFKLAEFDFRIEYLKGTDNPADLLSRAPLPVPQGYFDEEPLENLYSKDHSEIMKFIVGCINKRNEGTDIEQLQLHTHSAQQMIQNLRTVEQEIREKQHSQKSKEKEQSVNTHSSEDNISDSQSTIDYTRFEEQQEETEEEEEEETKVQTDTRVIVQGTQFDKMDETKQLECVQETQEAEEIIEELKLMDKTSTEMIHLDAQIEKIKAKFTREQLKEWQQKCKTTQKIIEKIEKARGEPQHNIHKMYSIREGILCVNNEEMKKRYGKKKKARRHFELRFEWSTYIPEITMEDTDISVRCFLLRQYHGLPITGHLGAVGTYRLIRQRYFWPQMFKDITKWINGCTPCQRRKFGKNHSQGGSKVVLQTRPFETLSIDLVGPFPENKKGNKYVLTIIDHFTRYPIAVPITSKKKGEVARALKKYVFLAFPYWPRKIVSDRGGEFVNGVIEEIYRQLGVRQKLTSHDNPQGNQVERFHRYMNAAISCFIKKKENLTKWEEYLDCAVYVYRCSTNNSTGYSPFYSLYGVHPIRPMDYILNEEEEKEEMKGVDKQAEQILQNLQKAYVDIHNNQLSMAIQRVQKEDNKKEPTFQIGDKVWCWKRYNPHKMEWRYRGPYVIVGRKANSNSYIIETGENAAGQKQTQNMSVRHLRLFRPYDERILDTSPQWVNETEELGILEEKGERNSQEEEELHLPDEVQTGTFAIVPYWHWNDIKEDKLPFGVVRIESYDKNTDKVIVRRYGNTDQDPIFGVQRPGWIDTSTARGRTDYKETLTKQSHKKHYVPYTNDVRTPKVTTTIDIYAVAHLYIHGFELTEDKTIPTKVLRHLAKNEWFTKFEPHPFEYEE